MGGVFDLDALEVEASGTPFVFKLAGQEFTLPAGHDADWRYITAIDTGRLEFAMRGLLGEAQYERFIQLPLASPKMGKLLEAYVEHQGVASGESEASTGS